MGSEGWRSAVKLVEEPYWAMSELMYGAWLEPTTLEYSLFSKMMM